MRQEIHIPLLIIAINLFLNFITCIRGEKPVSCYYLQIISNQ